MSRVHLAVVTLLLGTATQAQGLGFTPSAPRDVQVANAAASATDGDEGHKITGVLTTTVATDYFFRGIRQENQGFIFQPSLELSFGLFEGQEGAVNSGSLTLGTWNSLHNGPTGAAGGFSSWYESDFYAGLTFGLFDKMKAGAVYTAYHSPNGLFATVQELAFTFSYDDKATWGSDNFSGLQPSATVAFELDGQADAGTGSGTYGELGIQPSFTLNLDEQTPVTLSFPVTLGLSISDYYEVAGSDKALGFLDLGVSASMPMNFVPARFGAWTASAGVDLLFLGDNTKKINSGENFEVLGSLAISLSF